MKTVIFLFFFVALTIISGYLQAQRINVSGRVFEASTMQPLNSFSVVDKISGTGTMTSEDGFYSLFLQKGVVELEFSGLNYDYYKAVFTLIRDTVVDARVQINFHDKSRRPRKESVTVVQITPNEKPAIPPKQ